MRRKKQILMGVLAALIVIFLIVGISALLLARERRREEKERRRQEALEALEKVLTVTPAPSPTAAPTPTPTPVPSPTAVPTPRPAFDPDGYWDYWYSTDGYVSICIYDISNKSVSFTFCQTDRTGTLTSEADVTAEVAGNASTFAFSDTYGNYAEGNFIFDNGDLFVRIHTADQAYAAVYPDVECIMLRERPYVQYEPTAAPPSEAAPTPGQPAQTGSQTGEYYFPESDSRYLTDEEVSVYSSADLELAKNEIYARHGRQFVTDYIAEYFNSKSWYHGTVDPDTFDAQQSSIFNEYETANIAKIAEWEKKKREEGN